MYRNVRINSRAGSGFACACKSLRSVEFDRDHFFDPLWSTGGPRGGSAGGSHEGAGNALYMVVAIMAIMACGTLRHPGGNDVREIVPPRQPRAILRIRYSAYVN